MGFFKRLAKAGIEVVLLPVDVVKDVATLGGSVLGKQTTYTGDRVRDIGRDLDAALEELER